MKKPSLGFIAFLQALGMSLYCGAIGIVIWKGNTWFGPPHLFIGPAMFLILLVASVLVCSLCVLAYPAFLFWKKKQQVKALKLVGYTALWLIFFVGLILFTMSFC